MKTHTFDAVSFFSGLVAAVIGLLYLIPSDVNDMVDLFVDSGNWFWPVVFFAVGLAILVPALTRSRKDEDESTDPEA